MTTAFAFAPLSSVLRHEDRQRYRHLEEVQARFRRAEEFLREAMAVQVDFDELLDQPTDDLRQNDVVNRTAAAVVAMQLGVADRLQKIFGAPQWVVGSSLGDFARTVCAGACSFESALRLCMLSIDDVEGASQLGANVVAMTSARYPFTPEDFEWFQSIGLAVSEFSESLLDVAGPFDAIDQLNSKARERHWRIFHLIDVPLHSPYLAGCTEQARAVICALPFQPPPNGTRIYSSLLGHELNEPGELRDEFVQSLLKPHNWKQSATDLTANHGVKTFINIGPCRTLFRLLKQMGHEVLDAAELIQGA